MPYQSILKSLAENVPHSIGAIIVDWEGEAVQEFCHCDPYDLRFVGAHTGIILAQLKKLYSSGNGGEISDVLVTASGGHLIVGCIDREYSLVLNVERECPAALALYHFRITVAHLKKEF